MPTFDGFTGAAPRIAAVFTRRHAATGNLCLLATDGDAKLWGVVRDTPDLTGASAVEVDGGHLDITIWKPRQPERVVRKH